MTEQPIKSNRFVNLSERFVISTSNFLMRLPSDENVFNYEIEKTMWIYFKAGDSNLNTNSTIREILVENRNILDWSGIKIESLLIYPRIFPTNERRRSMKLALIH